MFFLLCFIVFFIERVRCEYFNPFNGTLLTEEQIIRHRLMGNLEQCTTNVFLPCDPDAWERVDGSCNNLNYPSYGAIHTPTKRLLAPVYGPDLRDRLSESGCKLPLVRKLRTNVLGERKASDSTFTQLMSYFILFIFADIGPVQDTLNYILFTKYCCEPRGRGDYKCTPHFIPIDDPVHRFSNVRCMNQTRPITFQTYGCLRNGTTIPARHNTETSVMDLSIIYFLGGIPYKRTCQGGELVVEEINGKIWPIFNTSPSSECIANHGAEENICFNNTSNGVLGSQVTTIWFFRYHNYIARQLAEVNPCWDDERLFQTAKAINIAIYMQIFMYELNAVLFGRVNLRRDRILSYSSGFRDLYDESILPQVTEEYIYVLRYFHTIQEAKIKLYDSLGYFSRTYPLVNLTLGPGATVKYFDGITQSAFRQPGGRADYMVDPDISEVGLGELQYSSDVPMNDLAKGRQFGFQGYIKYREYCSGKKYESFQDLEDIMDQDRIDILRDSYAALGDVDLMAGIWAERKIPGGQVPYTVYCLMTEQFLRFIKSDRFWYERADRPHAFTRLQLQEIRRASIASVFCSVGDSVTQIQKRAFIRISPKNPLVNCSDIPSINFKRWKTHDRQNNQNCSYNQNFCLDKV